MPPDTGGNKTGENLSWSPAKPLPHRRPAMEGDVLSYVILITSPVIGVCALLMCGMCVYLAFKE
jgi:hypothetical protein